MRRNGARLVRWLAACTAALVAWSGAHAGDVAIALERFGALRAFRPGDVTGIRLRLTSSRPEPVECLVQWDLANADGDMVSHARSVTLAPNQPVQRWLYGRLPPSNDATLAGQTFTVRVFEARDGVRTRELASLPFGVRDAEEASRPIGMQQDLIALLARGRMGLEALEAMIDGEVPSMNEATRLVPSVRLDDLPDRWEGMQGASTIVWADDGPQSLSPDAAAALLQWIERGGHLVIVLPESGDPWQVRGASHALAALMPKRGAMRVEGLAIEPLLPVLTKGGSMRRGGVRMAATLFDEATLERGWTVPVRAPDGAQPRGVSARGLAAQRPWGHGRVTIVGLDVAALHRGALVTDGAPQADVFWNPILGRRADAPSEDDYRAWQEAKPRRLFPTAAVVPFDVADEGFVRARIGQVGRATVGVLVVLAFFAAYWLAAVPGSWWVLRRRGRPGWSWPAFTLVAAVAAPVAWAISLAFGAPDAQVRHLTVADFTVSGAGQPVGTPPSVRANAWLSVALGGFGTSDITTGDDADAPDLLIDWAGVRSDVRRFPDSARSDRSVERPALLRAPSRATSTDLQAWWLGMPEAWGRVAWQDENQPVSMVLEQGGEPRASIQGALRHGLKQPLRDVQVLVTLPFHFVDRRWKSGTGSVIQPDQALPPCPARVTALAEPWDGGPLDLGKALFPNGPEPVASIGEHSLVKQMKDSTESAKTLASKIGRLGADTASSALPMQERLRMLSLFQMLQPPQYLDTAPRQRNAMDLPDTTLRMQRSMGRELDLSAWLTRPCVIVTGFIEDGPCPIPLRVDGEPATSTGTVMVRLILPLDVPGQGSVRPLRPGP